jgi:hypothetical protein
MADAFDVRQLLRIEPAEGVVDDGRPGEDYAEFFRPEGPISVSPGQGPGTREPSASSVL